MKAVYEKLQSLRHISGDPARHRFLIVGLPRSGTTYLMSLLNAHSQVVCHGERYNPRAVIGEVHDNSAASVIGRDSDPLGHLEKFFTQRRPAGVTHAGFKFMIGHNVRVLEQLEQMPDVSIIYIWRENRLAQISSLLKAAQDKIWAQTQEDDQEPTKITAQPRQISQRWHEFATYDYLFQSWLTTQSHPRLVLEYREMFQPGFLDKLCGFLELEVDPDMNSPLIKQNANTIAERFENPGPIEHYFNKIGYSRWLDDEL